MTGSPARPRVPPALVAPVAAGAAIVVVLVLILAGGSDDGPPSAGPGPWTQDDGLRKALRAVRAAAGDDGVVSVALGRDRIDVVLAGAVGGDPRALRAGVDGELRTVGGAAPAVPPGTQPIEPTIVTPVGAERIADGALRGSAPSRGPDARRSRIERLRLTAGRAGGAGAAWTVELAGADARDRSWSGSADGRRIVRNADGAPAPAPGVDGPAVAPVGLSSTSLLRERRTDDEPGGLAGALRELQRASAPAARLQVLRVTPARVRAVVRTGAEERDLEVDAVLRTRIGGPRPEATENGLAAAIGSADPAGPARALRAIEARGVPARRVLAATLVRRGAGVGWELSFGGVPARDRSWSASGDGRRISRGGRPR